MKVVFLIPTCNKAEILAQALKLMDELDPQPSKYVFLENNSEDDTLQVLTEWQRTHPSEILRLWLREDAVQVIGQKYGVIGLIRQMLLDRARKMNVDYAVFMDDDIFIPYTDFITRITAWRKHLVGTPYPYFAQYEGLRLSPIWFQNGHSTQQVAKTVCDGFNEVHSVAGGVMCISRTLLMDDRVNFLPLIDTEQRKLGEDIGYCVKARQQGYKVYVDCSMIMGHYVETVRQKAWHADAWHPRSEFRLGKKPQRKGVVLMPEKYMQLLAEIDAQLLLS